MTYLVLTEEDGSFGLDASLVSRLFGCPTVLEANVRRRDIRARPE